MFSLSQNVHKSMSQIPHIPCLPSKKKRLLLPLGVKQISSSDKYKSVIKVKLINAYIAQKRMIPGSSNNHVSPFCFMPYASY